MIFVQSLFSLSRRPADAVHKAQIEEDRLFIVHKMVTIGFFDRQVILQCFGWITQNQGRAPLVFLTQDFYDGRPGTFIPHMDDINLVLQFGEISEQPFQGYTLRSIKRTFKAAHEIAMQQK